MKNLILLITIIFLLLNCESSKPIVISQANPSEKYVRNTEVWGDISGLDSSKKYVTSGYFVNRKSKIQNFLFFLNLNISNQEIDLTFIETNPFYTVPIAAFSLKDKSRFELIKCLEKFIEWDKIAIQNNDKVEKEICSIEYFSDSIKAYDLPYNGEFKIIFYTDSPKNNALRFDFGEIRDPNNDSNLRRFDFHYLKKNEIIGLLNSISDREISKKVDDFIKKEFATQSRYK